jgi:hypothetical protein
MEPLRANNSRVQGAAIALAAALIFLFAYVEDPNRPAAVYPLGWYGWHDQGEYLNMLQSISGGTLGRFQYPLGYPVLAWTFAWLNRNDPFLPFDLLAFTAFVWLSWRIMEGIVVSQALRLMAALALAAGSLRYFIEPWSSTPRAVAMALILYACLCRPLNLRWGALAGAADGVMFAARVGDAGLGLAVIAVAAAFEWRKQRRIPWRFAAAAALACTLIISAVLAANVHYSGRLLGSYYKSALDQGVSHPLAILFKLYGYFLNPLTFEREWLDIATPVWRVLPLLLLAPGGLMLLWRKRRDACVAGIALLAAWLAIYGPFPAVSGLTLRFGSEHYAKVLFPILTVAGAFALGEFAAGRVAWRAAAVYGACIAALAAAPLAVHPHEVELAPSQVHLCCRTEDVPFVLDQNPVTRWTSGAPRKPGMTLVIDFGREIEFTRLRVDSSQHPLESPGPTTLETSEDGKRWSTPPCNDTSVEQGLSDYSVDPTPARIVRLRVNTSDPVNPWSIEELSVYAF